VDFDLAINELVFSSIAKLTAKTGAQTIKRSIRVNE
jgi:hypothetical protein